MVVTEIALLPLQEGKIPDDPSSPAGRVNIDALETVLSQPGVQQVSWGVQVEDNLLLLWFVDWDDIEFHKKFINSNVYEPFLDRFGGILNSGAKAYHARFTPYSPSTALSNTTSTTTEITTMWFSISYSQEDQNSVVQNAESFVSVLHKETMSYRTSAGGWVDEEIDIPETDGKGKAFVLLVNWASIEAKMEFLGTDAFKNNIHYLHSAKDLKKLVTVHSRITEITSGARIVTKQCNL